MTTLPPSFDADARKAQAKALKPRQEVDLPRLIERFGSEDKCRHYLEVLRWPAGVSCPRCGSTKISRIVKRHQFDCDGCRYQFSVRVGTVFEGSHLPLWKWFLATYLMIESRKGVSANQLKRTLGVSYKTAWYLCHRIRSAMAVGEEAPLAGIVEADETYIGGKASSGGKARGTKGGIKHKTMVVGAIQRDGELRTRAMPGTPTASTEVLHAFIEKYVADNAEAIYTDQHPGYRGIGDENTRHESVNHSAEEWVRGDVHTQSIESAWSLFKRSLVGSYHQLSVKHLQAYLGEFSFRFNNRENPFLFRDTIQRMLDADALPYSELITDKRGDQHG